MLRCQPTSMPYSMPQLRSLLTPAIQPSGLRFSNSVSEPLSMSKVCKQDSLWCARAQVGQVSCKLLPESKKLTRLHMNNAPDFAHVFHGECRAEAHVHHATCVAANKQFSVTVLMQLQQVSLPSRFHQKKLNNTACHLSQAGSASCW